MITQIRVDDRLIHGQVAVVWTKELNAPLLVVANDGSVAKFSKKSILV
ncbi:PTS sugar transporter subunit IIB [Enterococcus lactis]|nr:PTS sugar transporter subunit IIB [Enterococcus lactis]